MDILADRVLRCSKILADLSLELSLVKVDLDLANDDRAITAMNNVIAAVTNANKAIEVFVSISEDREDVDM